MNASQLIAKIERLRAAVQAAEERDVSSIRVKITQTADRIEMRHDFRGGMADPEIQNLAWQIIRSIADLKDHLRAWVAANAFAQTSPFQTGANSLVTNAIAIATPFAVLAIMVLAVVAMSGRISWGWPVGAVVGICVLFGTQQIVTWARGLFGV
nr:hypothetical protein Hi04_10k_c4921_00022 [uncultured bacterium]